MEVALEYHASLSFQAGLSRPTSSNMELPSTTAPPNRTNTGISQMDNHGTVVEGSSSTSSTPTTHTASLQEPGPFAGDARSIANHVMEVTDLTNVLCTQMFESIALHITHITSPQPADVQDKPCLPDYAEKVCIATTGGMTGDEEFKHIIMGDPAMDIIGKASNVNVGLAYIPIGDMVGGADGCWSYQEIIFDEGSTSNPGKWK